LPHVPGADPGFEHGHFQLHFSVVLDRKKNKI
jgi:hypothetical protein